MRAVHTGKVIKDGAGSFSELIQTWKERAETKVKWKA